MAMLRAIVFWGGESYDLSVLPLHCSVLMSTRASTGLCFRIDDSGAPRQISIRTLADPIECKSPPSNKTIVHSSVRPGETYSSHHEVRNRVPENIVDGNYFLIRRSTSRLKLRSTIRGLSRSYLVYLPHECNVYNTHERLEKR